MAEVVRSKTSTFVERAQKSPDGPKRVPDGQKHFSLAFWSLLDHFGMLTNHPYLTIFGPSSVMNGGPKNKNIARLAKAASHTLPGSRAYVNFDCHVLEVGGLHKQVGGLRGNSSLCEEVGGCTQASWGLSDPI